MSSTLRPPHPPPFLRTTPRATTSHPQTRIRCGTGPRSNRGPLVKGRILSTEAILAIQSLKRSTATTTANAALSRLLKSDLLAALRELLRQNHLTLALHVFAVVKTEPWYSTDVSLYADIVLSLSRNGMVDEIDGVISGIESEEGGGGIRWEDKKGLGRLIRGLIGSERREGLVRVYRVMRRFGWGVSGSGVEVDEYIGKVLSKGFKRFGEVELAKEVDLVVQSYLDACLGR